MNAKEKKVIERIGIVVNPTKTESFPLIKQVVDWLEDKGLEVLFSDRPNALVYSERNNASESIKDNIASIL